MILKTVQWNIGGANIRRPEADATLVESYSEEGLGYCIEKLREYSPDLVTLQESHADDMGSQAQVISKQLGFQHFINDAYDQSHINPSQRLCQSVISRFPINKHSFKLFFNPHYRKVRENGQEWVSHDKGISTCHFEGIDLVLQTLHLLPFHVFDVNLTDNAAQKVIRSIEGHIEKEHTPYLLQGDFNYEDLKSLLPDMYQDGLEEMGEPEATTPKGRVFDHVLSRGIALTRRTIDSGVLTDHFPIVSTFEL